MCRSTIQFLYFTEAQRDAYVWYIDIQIRRPNVPELKRQCDRHPSQEYIGAIAMIFYKKKREVVSVY
jgi:hypothetical protein